MTHPSGLQLFAAPDCTECIQAAKDYIVKEGYTSDDVKLVRFEGQILVVVR